MENQTTVPELIPDQYTKSKFWRFLLDTKEDSIHPEEPRFKQFSENLRNYAVTAVMFKAAQMMVVDFHTPFLFVGRYLLLALAASATALCCAQQFGLLIISFHWYIGWSVRDYIASNRDRNTRKLYKKAGLPDGKRTASMKSWCLIVVPALFLWAMLSFIFTPLR